MSKKIALQNLDFVIVEKIFIFEVLGHKLR